MTDYQLAMMKTLERQVLVASIESAREHIPEDAPREKHTEHQGGIRPLTCMVGGPCPDDHYTEITGEPLCLVPFFEILDSLDSQIALLKGKAE